jgi:hypothetical protein
MIHVLFVLEGLMNCDFLYTPSARWLIGATLVAVITAVVAVAHTRWTHWKLTGAHTWEEAVALEFRRQLRIELGLEEDTIEVITLVRR